MSAVAMPSTEEVRFAAEELIQATHMLDLASAMSDGDRILSYDPFIMWLCEGSQPNLFLKQFAERLISEIADRGSKKDLKELMSFAMSCFLED